MLQGLHANWSVSSLSLDQSNQSDSPNGKITPAVLCLWCLVKFWKCQTAVPILPHEAKALLELFCLQANVFGWRQNSSSCALASWGIIKCMILHGQIRTGSDWGFSKFLWIRTGSDSILSEQDWARTEKFHSPLISAIRIRKLSEGVLWCTTYIFVLCLFCLQLNTIGWSSHVTGLECISCSVEHDICNSSVPYMDDGCHGFRNGKQQLLVCIKWRVA